MQQSIQTYSEPQIQQFPPVCPHCGATMVWSADCDASDLYDDIDPNGIIQCFHCSSCGTDAEYLITEEGLLLIETYICCPEDINDDNE